MTNKTEISFHGTNGWFDSELGCTSCLSIIQDDLVLIFDAGTGIRRILPELVKGKDIIIFLSHLHLDHSVGLHFLQRFQPRSLKIIIPQDLAEYLRILIAPPFTGGFIKSKYSVTIQEVATGEYVDTKLHFSAHKLVHSTTVFGYRLYLEGKVFAYCVDTKMCPELIKAASNAEILVCDCSVKNEIQKNEHFHMTPNEAMSLAECAEVKRLVLTHFGCTKYICCEDRLELLKLSNRFSGELLIANDGMRIIL